jgi:uncharacterized protein YdaU (DUF1376 family)
MIDDDRLPWFHCFPSKWLDALGGLPADQKLVYSIMLLRIYDARGACMDSLDAIATRCGINKRRTTDALDALFRAGKLVRIEGGIHNPRAIEHIERGNALRAERQRAGAGGGKRAAEIRKQNQTELPSKAIAKGKQKEKEVEDSLFPNGNKAPVLKNGNTEEADLFRRGKEILGPEAGGLIKKVLKAKDGNVPQARAAIEMAVGRNNPREYIGGVIRAGNRTHDDTVDGRL